MSLQVKKNLGENLGSPLGSPPIYESPGASSSPRNSSSSPGEIPTLCWSFPSAPADPIETRAKRLWKTMTRGLLSLSATKPMRTKHLIESMHPLHPSPKSVKTERNAWRDSNSPLSFFEHLEDTQFPYPERVSYFTDEELKNYHCSVSATPSGECLLMQRGTPLKDGTYLCVLDPNNRLYATKESEQRIGEITYMVKHSSLSRGQGVRYAGEVTVRNGIVTVLNPKSGHYYPGEVEVQRMLTFLQEHQVLLSTIEFRPIPAKCLGSAP